MKWILILLFTNFLLAQTQSNQSPEYGEVIKFYKKLDKQFKNALLIEMGRSDVNEPIYIFVLNAEKTAEKTFEKAKKGTTVLINNAIHPGEPDGVNASMIFAQNWLKNLHDKTEAMIAIIPAYNVGGMLNRGPNSRANQEGPANYGFRGNAQNLDLNRDFIKMDSPNAKTFAKIFHSLDPDLFVDTHVSNGADYQYTFTLITSLRERLAPSMRSLTYDSFLPKMTIAMKEKSWDWVPYVETKGETPESGIEAFNDLPRYANGYASLFHSMAFTAETHMLKPFDQRVKATYDFIAYLCQYAQENAKEIEKARVEARSYALGQSHYAFDYSITEKVDSILFKGYTALHPISELTGLPRLKYDRTQAFEKNIPYFCYYQATDSVLIPKFYVLSASEEKTIDYLKRNKVKFHKLKKDSLLVGQHLRIQSFSQGNSPYEGHFPHREVKSEEVLDTIKALEGSILIPTNQVARNFIVHVLEPRCEDSYFTWNFYDSYLQQKEWFSSYVFEDKALEILTNNPKLKSDFEEKKKNDPKFAASSWEQLYYVYKNSPYFEKETYMFLPIMKLY